MTDMEGFYVWLGATTVMVIIGIYFWTKDYRTYRKNKKIYYAGLGICSLPKYDKMAKGYRIGGLVRPRFPIPDLRNLPPYKDKVAADDAFQKIMINEINKERDNLEETLTRYNYILFVFVVPALSISYAFFFYKVWKQHEFTVNFFWLLVLCWGFALFLQIIVNIINKKIY
jgi:hypothetical protein